MVDGLLRNVGIGIVLPCRSSYLATSASVQIRTGTSPAAMCRKLMNSLMSYL